MGLAVMGLAVMGLAVMGLALMGLAWHAIGSEWGRTQNRPPADQLQNTG
jgi:hypothetical protein